jgi:hypothetical protein
MSSRFALSALVSAAALVAGANNLNAQQTAAAANVVPRLVASYAFQNAPRDVSFPRSVTVADSAGTLLASVALTRDNRVVPMTVNVIENNLVLQGATPEGILTLVLDRINEGGATTLTSGSWTLGRSSGALRPTGTAQR